MSTCCSPNGKRVPNSDDWQWETDTDDSESDDLDGSTILPRIEEVLQSEGIENEVIDQQVDIIKHR